MSTVRRPTLKLLTASLALFWLPVILLFSIANQVREKHPLPGDVPILEAIHHTFPSSWSDFFLVWTTLGSAVSIVCITALLCGLLVYRHRKASALLVLFGVAGAAAANVVLKAVFERTRPSLWHSIVQEHSFSFPSGHAMASSALVFCLIAISWRSRWRWPVAALGVAFMVLVGSSRLYFGVHYPSDVLAGWMASLAWVVLVSYIISRPYVVRRFARFTGKVQAQD